ncbi:site-specific integrase [Bacillus thuringiensis]|uniref:site-specific integrase n=1 Tax=Bacillus thuringiensis TaxID=1428 RepID=UPI000BF6807A|nr:site-specific integrase [Bacillus thuringiensis]PEQ66174.1 integrase [Bacillus thuringiensis]
MQLKKIINMGSTPIAVTESITYNDINVSKFENIFNDLLINGYIIAKSFDDDEWLIPCNIQNTPFKLSFHKLFSYKKLCTIIKYYLLLRRASGISPSSIETEFNILRKIILATEGVTSTDQFEKLLSSFSIPWASTLALVLKEFLKFSQLPGHEKYIEICDSFPSPKWKNRDLPNFYHVLLFDEIINDFKYKIVLPRYHKYYPIILWWTITNIIPMRPNEFLRMKYNCLHEKNDGKTWIVIPRSKQKFDSPKQQEYFQHILITDDISKAIKDFQYVLNTYNIHTDNLFPQEFYGQFFSRGIKRPSNRILKHQFQTLLNNFYTEIVEQMYSQHSLDKISPGDTRHFAIINMFLQGFNVLSIARLAGQTTIQHASNYYSHAKLFAQSYVYRLTQTIVEKQAQNKMSGGFLGTKRKIFDNRILYSPKNSDQYQKVDYGYCTDKNFPNNCVEDCRICVNHYFFNPSIEEYDEAIKWLESYSRDLENRINDHLEYIKEFSLSKSHERVNYHESLLTKHSRQLLKYMDHKAIIDAKFIEE